ncbi:MAG: DoxX family protein [Candidatus Pacearchaeota archaeon]|jgi:putative oxidoreductase
MDNLSKLLEKNQDIPYFVFRILIGLFFLLHGVAKYSFVMSGEAKALIIAAFVLEIVIGAMIILGLFTRYASIVGALEMLVAYFMSHLIKDGAIIINPLKNGGETALLFFAAFLVLLAFGARIWSLDKMMNR